MIKRQLPVIIVIVVGFLALGGHFINNVPLKNFIDNDATQWYDIIAGFAVFLGSLNLLKLHLTRVSRKTKNWQYSIFSVLGFLRTLRLSGMFLVRMRTPLVNIIWD